MQGVEILNTLPIYSTYWELGLLSGLGIALIILVGVIFVADRLSTDRCILISTILAVISMLFGALIGECFHKELVETRYEVRLDDTVNLDEFMDKYEFIEQRENSWIVKEKN